MTDQDLPGLELFLTTALSVLGAEICQICPHASFYCETERESLRGMQSIRVLAFPVAGRRADVMAGLETPPKGL